MMGYRFKFLVFLSVFLTGAFSIIAWKAFRVYSESYTSAAVQSEMNVLEERVRGIVGELERFKTVANAKDVEIQIKALQIPLMAHVVFADGKWKAQWFEGATGMRDQAKGLASQIAFDSTPQSRNSWAMVRYKDRSTGYAFIIPRVADNGVHFFSFFMDQKGLAQVLKKNSVVESLHVVSPQAGEIFSSNTKDMRLIEGRIKTISGQTQGILASKTAANRIVLYQFHPFLQAYVFKVMPQNKVASLPLSRFYGLIVFALILGGIAVYALNLLFGAMFDRLNLAVAKIRAASGMEELPIAARDELVEVEFLAETIESKGLTTVPSMDASTAITSPLTPTAPAPMEDSELTKNVRSRIINCLGYMNRLKTQFQLDSPHMTLLEQELREMRKLVDPQTAVKATVSVQPAFNPILSTYQKELGHETVKAEAVKKEAPKPVVTQESNMDMSAAIRRPKREINDIGEL